jgi:iron-sulfur cluster repair protein YtfE (RIC family)
MGNAGITEYLTSDHRGIDELFEQAQKRVRDGQAALAREPFEKFAARLGRHIRLEEEVVFPLFEARTRIAGPAQVMRREHRLLEAHLEQARLALASEDLPRFAAAAASLGALLGEHNMKEERIVYPKTDQALGEERIQLAAELKEA